MELAFAVLVVCAAQHAGSRRQGGNRYRTCRIFSSRAAAGESARLFQHRFLANLSVE